MFPFFDVNMEKNKLTAKKDIGIAAHKFTASYHVFALACNNGMIQMGFFLF